MPMIGVRAEVMKMFFDREAVMKKIRANHRRFLARSGAYVRKTARQSIRKARKNVKIVREGKSAVQFALEIRNARYERSSKPGQPPKSRTGHLRNNIFFAFEPPRNVVIGPVKLGGKGLVPKVLEKGGLNRRRLARGGTKVDRIAPRPYMAPALRKTTPQLKSIAASSYRR